MSAPQLSPGNPAGRAPRVEEFSMSKESTRSVVVAAGEVVTKDGKTHKQGATVSVPDVEARDLIRAGVVRAAETPKSTGA
jgi:hypothetical protein